MEIDAGAAEFQELDAMLLDAAQLGVRLKRLYRKIKPDPGVKYFVYVLELQGGKMYVGTTDNIYARLLDHVLMTPSAAAWVREHGPVTRVVEIARAAGSDDETYKTLEYMDLFGWDRVRGAGWCRADLRSPPNALADFRRTRTFQYLTREQIDDVNDTVRALAKMTLA